MQYIIIRFTFSFFFSLSSSLVSVLIVHLLYIINRCNYSYTRASACSRILAVFAIKWPKMGRHLNSPIVLYPIVKNLQICDKGLENKINLQICDLRIKNKRLWIWDLRTLTPKKFAELWLWHEPIWICGLWFADFKKGLHAYLWSGDRYRW